MHSRKRDASPQRPRREGVDYGKLPSGKSTKRKGPYDLRKKGRFGDQEEAEAQMDVDVRYSADKPPPMPEKDDAGFEIWDPASEAERPKWNRPVQNRVYDTHPDQREVTIPNVGKLTVYKCAKSGCEAWCPRTKRERKSLNRTKAENLKNIDGIEITKAYCEVQHKKPWRKFVIKHATKREMEVQGVMLDYYRTRELVDVYHRESNLEIWCKTCNKKDSKSGKGVSGDMLPEWH